MRLGLIVLLLVFAGGLAACAKRNRPVAGRLESESSTVVNDGRTLNVGDVVEVRVRTGRIADWFVRTVRKCNDVPGADEPLDLRIGCKSFVIYNDHGYGGEKYVLSNF